MSNLHWFSTLYIGDLISVYANIDGIAKKVQ